MYKFKYKLSMSNIQLYLFYKHDLIITFNIKSYL